MGLGMVPSMSLLLCLCVRRRFSKLRPAIHLPNFALVRQDAGSWGHWKVLWGGHAPMQCFEV